MQPGTTHHASHISDYSDWAMDNGCFSSKGAFDADEFVKVLEDTYNNVENAWETCRFAVAPDVFDVQAMKGDPIATIERSKPFFQPIRDTGVPVALVFQDGLEQMPEIIPWDDFDVVFIGGGDAFKLGYPDKVPAGNAHYRLSDSSIGAASETTQKWARLLHRCHEEGKWIHVGRVNSYIRYLFTYVIGADSCDGTFIKFGGPKNLERMRGWFRKVDELLASHVELPEIIANFLQEQMEVDDDI
jgi:hypothetical protein